MMDRFVPFELLHLLESWLSNCFSYMYSGIAHGLLALTLIFMLGKVLF